MITQSFEKLVKIYLKLKVLKKELKCTCKYIKFKIHLSLHSIRRLRGTGLGNGYGQMIS